MLEAAWEESAQEYKEFLVCPKINYFKFNQTFQRIIPFTIPNEYKYIYKEILYWTSKNIILAGSHHKHRNLLVTIIKLQSIVWYDKNILLSF